MLDGRVGGGGEVVSVGFAGSAERAVGGVSFSSVVASDCCGGLKPSEIVAAEKSRLSSPSPSPPSPTLTEILTELLLESLRSKSDAFEFPRSMAMIC